LDEAAQMPFTTFEIRSKYIQCLRCLKRVIFLLLLNHISSQSHLAYRIPYRRSYRSNFGVKDRTLICKIELRSMGWNSMCAIEARCPIWNSIY